MQSPRPPECTEPGFHNALSVFRNAAKLVPAYGHFLTSHGIDPDAVTTPAEFAQVPPVDKANYLMKYPMHELLPGGWITEAGLWSSSSGTSGAPFFFPRGEESLRHSVVLYRRIFESVGAGPGSTLLVIAYAMGNWVGGTYTCQAAVQLHADGFPMSVAAPGARADAVRETIAALGPAYDRVILAGYPPMVRDILDGAGADVLDQDLRIVLAGEAIGEDWRDLVLRLIGKPGRVEDTNLTYGTADAGIMAHETATSIAVRRLAAEDPALRHRLFGAGAGLPTFVEYDPELRYVETDPDGALLFTIETSIPLVRYRIGDVGEVHTAAGLRELLRTAGHDVPVTTSTPDAGFLVLRRREKVATTFYSVKLYPDGVQSALTDRAFAGTVSGRFCLDADPDSELRPVLNLLIELRPNVIADDAFVETLRTAVIAGMEAASTEYRELRVLYGRAADPVITLLPYGSPEFSGIKVTYGSGR